MAGKVVRGGGWCGQFLGREAIASPGATREKNDLIPLWVRISQALQDASCIRMPALSLEFVLRQPSLPRLEESLDHIELGVGQGSLGFASDYGRACPTVQHDGGRGRFGRRRFRWVRA